MRVFSSFFHPKNDAGQRPQKTGLEEIIPFLSLFKPVYNRISWLREGAQSYDQINIGSVQRNQKISQGRLKKCYLWHFQ